MQLVKNHLLFFKLILKNGDDNMVCQIYDGKEKNGTKIITLIEKANAAVDKNLINHVFESGDMKLTILITSSGVTSFNLIKGSLEESLFVYKSKSKEPVKFYFGDKISNSNIEEGFTDTDKVAFLLQLDTYAYLDYSVVSGTIFNKSDVGFSFFSWESDEVDDSERTVKVTYQENGSLKGEYSNEESYGTYNFKKLFN